MSGFSAEWLALREPADHRSRDPGLAAALTGGLGGRGDIEVVDLGCGTGSNLRATHALLGARQRWTLVDHDPALLAAARAAIAAWADGWRSDGGALIVTKSGRELSIAFRQADLAHDLDRALGPGADLVTASALFDLCSVPFIDRFAEAVARRRSVFYTVLTYDGRQTWEPPHVSDAALLNAFHAHQQTDKGFGVSAGPGAPAALWEAFERQGYRVSEGDSPWRLGDGEAALVKVLAEGFAGAARETGRVSPAAIADWLAVTRSGCLVGHLDTLATP